MSSIFAVNRAIPATWASADKCLYVCTRQLYLVLICVWVMSPFSWQEARGRVWCHSGRGDWRRNLAQLGSVIRYKLIIEIEEVQAKGVG